MSCLVVGLLCLGTMGLLFAVVILSEAEPLGALIPGLLGAFFLVLGIWLFRRKRDDLSLGYVLVLAVGLFVGTWFVLSLIPAFLCYRRDARRSLCINNLRLIDHAKVTLAIQNSWTSGQIIADTPEAIWAVLDPRIDGANQLECYDAPGKHYLYGPIGATPRCPAADTFTEHVYEPE